MASGYKGRKIPIGSGSTNSIIDAVKKPATAKSAEAKAIASQEDTKHKTLVAAIIKTINANRDIKVIQVWKLLDEVGFRGYTEMGAQFADKHPNFLINTGSATAQDLENLIKKAQDTVWQKKGVKLECEIQFLGKRDK